MKIFQILLICFVGVILASGRATQQEEKRLIKTSQEKPGEWMTQEEIFSLIKNRKKFIDITDSDSPDADPQSIKATTAPPTELKYQQQVRRVTNNLNSNRVQEFVQKFSDYHNRFHSSATGRESQLWLFSQVQETIKNYAGNASVVEVEHGNIQRSIVARLEGTDPTLKSEVVIFGAHLDSVNMFGGSFRAPGADDNASGSSVVLETLRDIVEAGLVLKRTVEFQWYAAEEIGLIGSKAIAQDYKRKKVNVVAMLNMDVVGYHTTGINDIGVYTDNGNRALAQFLRILTDEYLTYGRRDRTCGYGCSDHASFTNAGFPATMASEVNAHPLMHTAYDSIEKVNFTQVAEFIKLAIGFIVEMAEPVTSNP